MKILRWMKDGGPESRVHGLFVIEIKSLFSLVVLRFSNGSREAYHSHAFDAVSWLLSGSLKEEHVEGHRTYYGPSWRPIFTAREVFHKVTSRGTSWVVSFRGPWADHWFERTAAGDVVLTHGRREIA